MANVKASIHLSIFALSFKNDTTSIVFQLFHYISRMLEK